jgi:hypothetical protein
LLQFWKQEIGSERQHLVTDPPILIGGVLPKVVMAIN